MSNKIKIVNGDMPKEFSEVSIGTVRRIVGHPNVLGVMYFRNNSLLVTTVPENFTQVLTKRIPLLTSLLQRALTEITASINDVNPVVDRIMEDDSVESVIMTNKEGNPILTNVTIIGAAHYGKAMHTLGKMARLSTKELDNFDELLVLRVKTKKFEMIAAPHSEFNVIVVQHARQKTGKKKRMAK